MLSLIEGGKGTRWGYLWRGNNGFRHKCIKLSIEEKQLESQTHQHLLVCVHECVSIYTLVPSPSWWQIMMRNITCLWNNQKSSISDDRLAMGQLQPMRRASVQQSPERHTYVRICDTQSIYTESSHTIHWTRPVMITLNTWEKDSEETLDKTW